MGGLAKKKKAKNEKNMVRSVRILIFQSPKKKGLFLHFWKNPGLLHQKRLSNTLLLRYYLLFFLKPPRLDPPVWLRFWTGSFGSGDFFRKTLLVTHRKGGCKLQMVTVLIGLHLPKVCKSTTNVHRKFCALSKLKALCKNMWM